MNEEKELKKIMEEMRGQLKAKESEPVTPDRIKITMPKPNLKVVYSYLTIYSLGLVMGVVLTVVLFGL